MKGSQRIIDSGNVDAVAQEWQFRLLKGCPGPAGLQESCAP